jgi:hypothetical protein
MAFSVEVSWLFINGLEFSFFADFFVSTVFLKPEKSMPFFKIYQSKEGTE